MIITQDNLLDYLLTILDVVGEITLQTFIERVPNAFELSEYDLEPSDSRPSEARYVQRCRNINCHRKFPTDKVSYHNDVFKKIK